jgi:hypothetical protein
MTTYFRQHTREVGGDNPIENRGEPGKGGRVIESSVDTAGRITRASQKVSEAAKEYDQSLMGPSESLVGGQLDKGELLLTTLQQLTKTLTDMRKDGHWFSK